MGELHPMPNEGAGDGAAITGPPASAPPESMVHYPTVETMDPATMALVMRDQRIVELEGELQHLQGQRTDLEKEIAEREKRVAAAESALAEVSKDPRFRVHVGEPEHWKSSMWDCTADTSICLKGLFVPCWLFGENAATIASWEDDPRQPAGKGCLKVKERMADTVHATHQLFRCCTACTIHCALGGCFQCLGWYVLGPVAAWVTLAPCYAYEFRARIRQRYHLREEPFSDFCTSCLCHPCALCQEAREIESREGEAARTRLKSLLKEELHREIGATDGKQATTVVAPPQTNKMSK